MSYLTLIKILGPVVVIGLVLGYIGHLKHDIGSLTGQRDKLRGEVTGIVGVVAEVAGVPKLQVRHAPAAVRRIGADRDTYYRNWQLAKGALLDQTQRVVALGAETRRLREQSDRQQALVAQLKAQRDGWIRRAQAASSRTQRLSDQQEAAACEAAMDDLYKAGF